MLSIKTPLSMMLSMSTVERGYYGALYNRLTTGNGIASQPLTGPAPKTSPANLPLNEQDEFVHRL